MVYGNLMNLDQKFTIKQLLQSYLLYFGGLIIALVGYALLKILGIANTLISAIAGFLLAGLYYRLLVIPWLKRNKSSS